VAFWHDFDKNLLIWAWSVFLCLLIEKLVFFQLNNCNYNKYWFFKYIVIIIYAIDANLQLISNFIGFGSGMYFA
jgi:hypothetical protein